LHLKATYAIIAIDKRDSKSMRTKNEIPEPCCSTARGFFFTF